MRFARSPRLSVGVWCVSSSVCVEFIFRNRERRPRECICCRCRSVRIRHRTARQPRLPANSRPHQSLYAAAHRSAATGRRPRIGGSVKKRPIGTSARSAESVFHCVRVCDLYVSKMAALRLDMMCSCPSSSSPLAVGRSPSALALLLLLT